MSERTHDDTFRTTPAGTRTPLSWQRHQVEDFDQQPRDVR